jgi:large subunit ribosomal protein L24
MIKRHTKPNAKNKQGGILEREGSIAISNVMVYCEAVQKPSRIRMKTFEDGRKVRVYQKAPDEVLDKA